MKTDALVGLAVAALAGFHPSAARAASLPVGVAAEMASLFDEMCLRAFPDRGAVERLTGSPGFTPMPQADAATLLEDGAGRGWLKSTASSIYKVTIGAPPFLACSVRRSGPAGLATIEPYATTIAAYAAARGASLHPLPPLSARTAAGDDIRAIPVMMLPRGSRVPTESFTVIGTATRPPRGQGRALEIRFVHRFLGGDHTPS